jgi:hypothetical protein
LNVAGSATSSSGYSKNLPATPAGFYFSVQTHCKDCSRRKSLVNLQDKFRAPWALGVVRRITDDGSNQRRVGIELLSGLAMVVKLAPAGGARPLESERRRSAVLLSSATDDAEDALVLMRAGHYSQRQTLEMQLQTKRVVLQPAELIEAGEDFDCARYKVLPA